MKNRTTRQDMDTRPQNGSSHDTPTSPKSRVRTLAVRLLGYAGIAVFVFLIIQTGPREIWNTLRRMSALEILALFGLRALYWLIRTWNWKAILAASQEEVKVRRIFSARLAAYAVSYMTPAGNLGGETARIFMLDRIDRKKTLATVIIDKTIEFFAGIFSVAVAVVFLITQVALPRRQKLSLFAVIAAIILLLVFLLMKQRKGLFTWMLDSLRRVRVRIPFLEKRRDKILETDAHMVDFYSKRYDLFFLIFSSYFFQAWLWALEIYMTFVFLGGALTTYINCYLIVTLGSFYSFLPIPGSMGVYELTYVSIFAFLRIPMSAGMAVILVRRILGLAWAGMGLWPFLKKKRRIAEPQTSGPVD